MFLKKIEEKYKIAATGDEKQPQKDEKWTPQSKDPAKEASLRFSARKAGADLGDKLRGSFKQYSAQELRTEKEQAFEMFMQGQKQRALKPALYQEFLRGYQQAYDYED